MNGTNLLVRMVMRILMRGALRHGRRGLRGRSDAPPRGGPRKRPPPRRDER